MLIEGTTSEIVIRLPLCVDAVGLQELVDYLGYREIAVKSVATQAGVDAPAEEIKKGWRENDRGRFIK